MKMDNYAISSDEEDIDDVAADVCSAGVLITCWIKAASHLEQAGGDSFHRRALKDLLLEVVGEKDHFESLFLAYRRSGDVKAIARLESLSRDWQQLAGLLRVCVNKQQGQVTPFHPGRPLVEKIRERLRRYNEEKRISYHTARDSNISQTTTGGKQVKGALTESGDIPFIIKQINPEIGKEAIKASGRKHVNKLSIPYRVFIKSRVKTSKRSILSCPQTTTDDRLAFLLKLNVQENSITSPKRRNSREEDNHIVRIAANLLHAQPHQEGSNKDLCLSKRHLPNSAPSSLSCLLTSCRHRPQSSSNMSRQSDTSTSTNLGAMKHKFPQSLTDLADAMPTANSMTSSVPKMTATSPPKRKLMKPPTYGDTNEKTLKSDDTSPIKRRKIRVGDMRNTRDSPTPRRSTQRRLSPNPLLSLSNCTSGSNSPVQLFELELGDEQLVPRCDVTMPPTVSVSSLYSSTGVSGATSPETSPALVRKGAESNHRDELWAAIQNDYHFLMDDDLIETCKSTESDFSWESDDFSANPHVSFTEFLQQYKELSDWLNHIKLMTQKQSESLSEKYLNQSFHEEMLQRSPRRKLFNDYAKQLLRRYPNMKEEITQRMTSLNNQWVALETAIKPAQDVQSDTMMKDLEADLETLRLWLHEVEEKLLPMVLSPDWSRENVQQRLNNHQVLQREIESRSKPVSAVLKLCSRLNDELENTKLVVSAAHLEKRWHGIWLQSLEWQCRLEEALVSGNKRRTSDWGSYGFIEQTVDQATGTSPLPTAQDWDSDDSRCDVIPFNDSEYERISVETDSAAIATVEDGSQRSPDSGAEPDCVEGGAAPLRSSSSSEAAIDSALGRSVSDGSIQGGRVVQQGQAPPPAVAMRGDQVGPVAAPIPEQRITEKMTQSKTGEQQDVGYSSESHSNDEPDQSTQIVAHQKAASAPIAPKPEEVQVLMLPASATSTWRNSMTSAYDTSSNCSEPPPVRELESPDFPATDQADSMTSSGSLQRKVHCLVTSPSQEFYKMTAVDTDSEPVSAGDRAEGQNTSDDEPALERSFEEPDNSRTLSPTQQSIFDDVIRTSSPTIGAVHSENGEQSNYFSSHDLYLSTLNNNTADVTFVHSPESLFMSAVNCSARERQRSESMQPQIDSDSAREMTSSSQEEVATTTSLLAPEEPPPKESVRKLIQQAELLVKDVQNDIHPNRQVAPTSKQTSCASEDCDASSEAEVTPSSSSVEGEHLSAASSERDVHFPRHDSPPDVVTSMSTTETSQSEKSQHGSPLKQYHSDDVTQATKLHQRRQLLMQPETMSVSEGAINNMRSNWNTSRNLRRTTSDTCACAKKPYLTHPRRRRKKRLKRSTSDEVKEEIDEAAAYHVQHVTSTPLVPPQDNQYLTVDAGVRRRLVNACKGATAVGASEYDHANAGVTSAAEFSGPAWDPYQMNPYSSVSDDPCEEKLDASTLTGFAWEQDFEDDNFQPVEKLHVSDKKAVLQRRVSSSRTLVDNSRKNESDSDLEDLHHVIEESKQHIAVVQHALAKKRVTMEPGVYVNPDKYAELLATCQTNIRCLQVISDTLDSEDSVAVVSDEDIQEVQDIIGQWELLHSLAAERQRQSKDLVAIVTEVKDLKNGLDEVDSGLECVGFNRVEDMEKHIRQLQTLKVELPDLQTRLVSAYQALKTFQDQHNDVQIGPTGGDLHEIKVKLNNIGSRITSRLSELQALLVSWFDFNETQKELEYLIARESQGLRALEMARDCSALGRQDLTDTVQDLSILDKDLSEFDHKISQMNRINKNLKDLADSNARHEMNTKVALLEQNLGAVRRRCQLLEASLRSQMTKTMKVNTRTAEAQTERARSPLARALRRVCSLRTLPLQLLLLLVAGLAYFMDGLTDPLTFNPELRYVRGNPPT